MKKITIALVLSILLGLCGCTDPHEHNWKGADCENPMTCVACNATEGSALGHDWQDATCTSAQKCSRCGKLHGEALGHTWEPATCEDAEKCSLCRIKKGEALGHIWQEATCQAPETCERCQKTTGYPMKHTVDNWTVKQKPTCTEPGVQTGVCSACGNTVEEPVITIDHVPGDWKVTQEPEGVINGIRIKRCTVCGYQVDVEYFNWTDGERESMYKKECKTYTYNEIARNPGKYKGEKAKLTGEVAWLVQDSYNGKIYYTMGVDITKGRYIYTDTVYVTFTAEESDERILEDDIIVIYGEMNGEKTYEAVSGASITIPYCIARYIDIK